MRVLGIVEIGRKQAFIFKSNRLKEIVGASMLIRLVSEGLWKQLPVRERLSHWDESHIVIEGGGHSIYLFDNWKDGVEFNRLLTEHVLRSYPGLQIHCTLMEFDPEQDLFPDAIDRLFQKLGKKRANHSAPLYQVSWGIERLCESTQAPAIDYYEKYQDERRAISAEIKAKLNVHDDHQKLVGYFRPLFPASWGQDKIVKTMAELKDEETGKVAVVHIDGNRMGAKFAKFREIYAYKSGENVREYNERYIRAYQKFSRDVDRAYQAAFQNMIETLENAITQAGQHSALRKFQGKPLPIRPIIFGGDDLSFIAPGSLGVEAARLILEYLQDHPLTIGEPESRAEKIEMHACAGVAIVRAGYPFARAHELAEQLCQNAKVRLLQDIRHLHNSGNEKEEIRDASLIDFHIQQGDWSGSVEDMRSRDYTLQIDGNSLHLTMKPLYVFSKNNRRNRHSGYHFDTFAEAVVRLSNRKVISRSKVKELRETIRRGPAEAARFVRIHGLAGKLGTFEDLALPYGEMFTTDGVCPYYDAIEAMDELVLLRREGVQA